MNAIRTAMHRCRQALAGHNQPEPDVARRWIFGLPLGAVLAGVAAAAAAPAEAADCGSPAARADARRLANGFVDFLKDAKLEHKALFATPTIDFWRSHFPNSKAEVRKYDMGPSVERKVKLKGGQEPISDVRTFVHEDGAGFTALWQQGATPLAMVCTVKGGKIVRFDEYIDGYYPPLTS